MNFVSSTHLDCACDLYGSSSPNYKHPAYTALCQSLQSCLGDVSCLQGSRTFFSFMLPSTAILAVTLFGGLKMIRRQDADCVMHWNCGTLCVAALLLFRSKCADQKERTTLWFSLLTGRLVRAISALCPGRRCLDPE